MTEEFKNEIDALFRNEKFLIYDAAMLQTIEEAKNGSPLAWLDIYESFLWNNNTKRRLSKPKLQVVKNLNIARFFNRLIVDYLKSNLNLIDKQPFTNWTQNKVDYIDLVMELHEAAIIEGLAKNYTESKQLFLETIKIMVNQVEFERWDFELFKNLHELIMEEKETKSTTLL